MNLSIKQNKIKIELYYTHQWIDHPLDLRIMVDDRIIHIDQSGKQDVYFNKIVALTPGNHVLKLNINNKTAIESYIKINKLVIDGANLTELMQQDSVFYGDGELGQQNTRGLYRNGEWQFSFSNPMLLWLIKKLSK